MKYRRSLKKWKSTALGKRLAGVFTGWAAKEKILTPLIVNLLSVFLIFCLAYAFQDKILSLFSPKPSIREYPLRCFLEPRNDEAGNVLVDLFVINLVENDQNGEALLASVRNHPQQGREVDSDIRIRMDDGLDGVIDKIETDDEYNFEKGEISIGPMEPPQKAGIIFVESIKGHAILKATIHTTEQRPISSRADQRTIPLSVSCPGGP